MISSWISSILETCFPKIFLLTLTISMNGYSLYSLQPASLLYLKKTIVLKNLHFRTNRMMRSNRTSKWWICCTLRIQISLGSMCRMSETLPSVFSKSKTVWESNDCTTVFVTWVIKMSSWNNHSKRGLNVRNTKWKIFRTFMNWSRMVRLAMYHQASTRMKNELHATKCSPVSANSLLTSAYIQMRSHLYAQLPVATWSSTKKATWLSMLKKYTLSVNLVRMAQHKRCHCARNVLKKTMILVAVIIINGKDYQIKHYNIDRFDVVNESGRHLV